MFIFWLKHSDSYQFCLNVLRSFIWHSIHYKRLVNSFHIPLEASYASSEIWQILSYPSITLKEYETNSFFWDAVLFQNRNMSKQSVFTHAQTVCSQLQFIGTKDEMRYVKKKFESPTGLEHPPITRRFKNLYSWFATKWQGGHGRGQIKTIN